MMMNKIGRSARLYAAGLGILGLSALWASAEEPATQSDAAVGAESSASDSSAEATIQKWPERSRVLAHAMIDKYGEPSRFDENSVVWEKNGPWRETVVYRKAPRGIMGVGGKDVIEQTISYNVPDEKTAELKRFDSRIQIDRTNGTLSSREESEALNFLALNLADEVVTGKRSAESASGFYRKTMKLSESGKSSAYMDGLDFTPADEKAVDDKPTAKDVPAGPDATSEPYRSGMPDRVGAPEGRTNDAQHPGDVLTPPNP